MRFSVRRRRKPPWTALTAAALVCVAAYTLWFMEIHLKPTLLAIAEARATMIATESINQVINEKISGRIDPQSLVSVKVDDRGQVVLLQPNTMEFNRLAAETTIQVQEALQKIPEEKIGIPVGQMLGSSVFASVGPKINVNVIPVGTVQVKVYDKFEQAGINQTRHLVHLLVTTEVRIVVPLVSKSVRVKTQVPIAEYVVVGQVPNTYVQFPFSPLNQTGGEKAAR